MTLAASTTVKYVAGDTIRLQYTVVDDAGNAVNITGYQARWTARDRAGVAVLSSAAPLSNVTVTLTDPTNGVFAVTAAAAATAVLRGAYQWQAEIESGGVVQTVSRGVLDVTASIVP